MVILGFDAGKHAMFKLKKALMLSGLVYGRSIEVIHARVPIIKFVDSVTQFRVDISFGMENGVRAAKIMNEFMAKFPALRFVTDRLISKIDYSN
jgi:non-canonical poly(A) RNA polymerase PAPD5/7